MGVKKTQMTEFVSLSSEEIVKKLAVARREVATMRMELRMGQLKDTAKYSSAKKMVARLMTALSAKKLSEIII